MVGGASAWASSGTAGARPCVTTKPEPRSETMGVMGGPTPVALALTDHGFKSDRSTALTSSSMSLMSERSGGSRHPCHGRHTHREPGGHMEINLPAFKDEDTNDAGTGT